MPDADVELITNAVMEVVSKVPIPGLADHYYAAGDGSDPNHDLPYLILTQISSSAPEGPLSDVDADLPLRYQVTALGLTRGQAELLRDRAHAQLNRVNLNAALSAQGTNRVVLLLKRDLVMVVRDERGLPTPRYNALSQYQLTTTPA